MKHSLHGLKPLYVVNLESRTDRLDALVQAFENFGVTDYTIIKGVTPAEAQELANKDNHVSNPLPDLACTLGHLKAIDYYVNNSNSEYGIIVEDDLSLDPALYWDFTWDEFIKSIDFDWNIIQLSIMNFHDDVFIHEMHQRKFFDQTATIYMIKKDYAKKMIDRYYPDKMPTVVISDEFIYDCIVYDDVIPPEKIYAVNLFTTNLNVSTHSDRLTDQYDNWGHFKQRIATMEYWRSRFTENSQDSN